MARLAPAAGESCYPITTNCRCIRLTRHPRRIAGGSRTAECCESQRFLEDHEQADLLDARYHRYRRVSAEQFGDATGVRRRVHPVKLTSPERRADRPRRDTPRLAKDPGLLDEPVRVRKQLRGRRYEQFFDPRDLDDLCVWSLEEPERRARQLPAPPPH